MITQDRIELNNRFVRLFQLLEERGAIRKSDRSGKGIGDFAEKILGNRAYGHIIRAFLNEEDQRVLDYHHARKICEIYGVNEHWLLEGKGSPFGLDLRVPTKPHYEPKANILFTTMRAFAGASVHGGSQEDREDATYFSLPGLAGLDLVAFPIEGNSMEPIIEHGDICICQPVNSLKDIKDNEIYAVNSNGSIWIKYLQKMQDSQGNYSILRCISANHLEHDPFEVEVNEFTRIYKVIRRVSNIG